MDILLFAPPGSLWPTLAALLFGLLIGSFLNVVIHRMPIMMQREFDDACAENCGKEPVHKDKYTLSVPRSACPHCGHHITALENIPVISYLALRGKCSGCKAKISKRYPAIELASGLMAALLIWTFGSGYTGLGVAVFGFLLLAMTFIDLDTQFLPDDLTYPLLWLGLIVNLDGALVPLRDAVLGAVAGYMALWSVNALYKLVRKHDGMGNGDFKLLGALGAWMGWQMLPAIILLSSVVGAVIGILMIALRKQDSETRIPFGPYLTGAGLLAMLYGPQIKGLMQAYLAP
jgi:leader peptidase (prepilin peptidase)/N-methyltransferase